MRTSLIVLMLLSQSCGHKHKSLKGDKGEPANETRVVQLEERVSALESLYASLNDLVSIMNTSVVDINSTLGDIELIQQQFDDLVINMLARIDALEQSSQLSDQAITQLQLDVQQLQSVAQLQISEVVDPCGDKANFADEVLLRLGDGSLVAYFESSDGRMLSLLEAGSFQTTDKQKCSFSVSATGQVTW